MDGSAETTVAAGVFPSAFSPGRLLLPDTEKRLKRGQYHLAVVRNQNPSSVPETCPP